MALTKAAREALHYLFIYFYIHLIYLKRLASVTIRACG